jgi:hypothetical protein
VSPRRFNPRTYMIVASGRSVLTFNAATSASSASTTIRSALPLTLSPTVNCQDIFGLSLNIERQATKERSPASTKSSKLMLLKSVRDFDVHAVEIIARHLGPHTDHGVLGCPRRSHKTQIRTSTFPVWRVPRCAGGLSWLYESLRSQRRGSGCQFGHDVTAKAHNSGLWSR